MLTGKFHFDLLGVLKVEFCFNLNKSAVKRIECLRPMAIALNRKLHRFKDDNFDLSDKQRRPRKFVDQQMQTHLDVENTQYRKWGMEKVNFWNIEKPNVVSALDFDGRLNVCIFYHPSRSRPTSNFVRQTKSLRKEDDATPFCLFTYLHPQVFV